MPFDTTGDAQDEALLIAAAAGDAAATRALTARLGPIVYAHALRMLGPDRAEAEDVTQEALLRLWRAAPGWTVGGAKPTTWLYRVTANLCIDRLRKRRGDMPLDDAIDPPDPTPSVESQMQARDRAAALDAALGTLPDRQRQAVILRYIDGLSLAETAQIMDIGPRAVESLAARGRKALAARLLPQRAALAPGQEG